MAERCNLTLQVCIQGKMKLFVIFSRGAVAQSVKRPSKGPGTRCNSTDVGLKHAAA